MVKITLAPEFGPKIEILASRNYSIEARAKLTKLHKIVPGTKTVTVGL